MDVRAATLLRLQGFIGSMSMWYFVWVLGVGFAVLLAILNAMWGENEAERRSSAGARVQPGRAGNL